MDYQFFKFIFKFHDCAPATERIALHETRLVAMLKFRINILEFHVYFLKFTLLQFTLIYAILAFVIDKPVNETARQKAQRIWRNNYIQNHIENEEILPTQEDITDQQIRSHIINIIRKLMNGRNDKILKYYATSIKSRQRRLLVEKLKRLQDGET